MATPDAYTKRPSSALTTHSSRPYYTRFLCKSVLFVVVLVALPLIPFQAPDLATETVFAKFWELFHLLFVGLAVSYGLLSRRKAGVDVDLQSNNVDDSHSYVPRMFHVSSVFDDESRDLSSFYEKNENADSDSRYFRSESKIAANNMLDEEHRFGSFTDETEIEDLIECEKINKVQAWNSQYVQGRSEIVVAEPVRALDDSIGHKPLGLPVRSLKSALRDSECSEYSIQSESRSKVLNSFSSNSNGTVNGEFVSLGSMKMEKKIDEFRTPPSPIHWRSSSDRTGMRENVRGRTQPVHSLSVDESQFEILKSGSLRSTALSSSKTNSMPQPQNRFSAPNSVCSESSNLNADEFGKVISSPSASPSPSPPRSRPDIEETSRHVLHSRHYSYGSMLEEEAGRGLDDDAERIDTGRKQDVLKRKNQRSRSLKLPAEVSKKGKNSRRSFPPDSVIPKLDCEDSSTKCVSKQYIPRSTYKEDMVKSSEDELNDARGNIRDDSFDRREGVKGSSKFGLEENEKDGSFSGSYPRSSTSPPTNGKASNESKYGLDSQQWSDCSWSEMEDGPVDMDRTGRKDLTWESNPGKEGKVSSRGKSVRTFRGRRSTNEVTNDGEGTDDQTADKLKMACTKAEAEYTEFQSWELEQDQLNSNANNNENLDLDRLYSTQTEKYVQQNNEGEEGAGESRTDSEEVGLENGRRDSGQDPEEVDRKAGEFIAKFREQMRLQKLTSGELPRGRYGGNVDGSYLR